MSQANYYCSLFTDADVTEEVMLADLASFLEVSSSGSHVENETGYICVVVNDDFNAKLRNDYLDGFLHYRYLLEVEPKAELGEENAIAFVAKVLEHLWSQNFAAVASCGYEDELPHRGGYKSIYTPAVKPEALTR